MRWKRKFRWKDFHHQFLTKLFMPVHIWEQQTLGIRHWKSTWLEPTRKLPSVAESRKVKQVRKSKLKACSTHHYSYYIDRLNIPRPLHRVSSSLYSTCFSGISCLTWASFGHRGTVSENIQYDNMSICVVCLPTWQTEFWHNILN